MFTALPFFSRWFWMTRCCWRFWYRMIPLLEGADPALLLHFARSCVELSFAEDGAQPWD